MDGSVGMSIRAMVKMWMTTSTRVGMGERVNIMVKVTARAWISG